MNPENKNQIYDVIIVGGGPAGLSAAIYTSRDRLDTLLIEKGITGGMINEATQVDNFPGFPEGISGMDLTSRMYQQAQKYGLKDVNAEVTGIEARDKHSFVVKTSDGKYTAKAVIIAGGSDKQKMDAPGEKEYVGRGVSYCATCDAPFYSNKVVAVVGGGNSALYEAMHLAKFAAKVYIIHRRDQLRATAVVQERARAEPKIEFILSSVVEAVLGGDFVEKLKLKNVATGKTSELKLDGVFVAIGLKPSTGYLKGLLSLDEYGMIVVNDRMETSVPGIFAAGDIRHNSIRQTVAAAGDGAIAALSAKRWVDEG
ncbi:MAG: thioredoxin-disulfide reductase [Dehalococcoidia bacterium]|nr:MAG: thioredoxin-disulfide reductase [Dehalococcoidia bacterium]